MLRVKVRTDGKWKVEDTFYDSEREEALAVYNAAPVPKMLINSLGIVHKQYTDNGFVYTGSFK